MVKDVKKRNWAIIGYPESLPIDWKEIIIKTGLPTAISPLHQYDINESGEVKKPHYHILICYSGPTSFNVVKRITEKLNCPIPEPVESVRGQYRYFTHKDNPEKYQYDEKEIQLLNGFNIQDYVEFTKSEINALKKRGISIIEENNFTEYQEIVDYCMSNDLSDLFDVVSSNTIFFNSYLTSRRHKTEKLLKERENILKKAYLEFMEHDSAGNETVEKIRELFSVDPIIEDGCEYD